MKRWLPYVVALVVGVGLVVAFLLAPTESEGARRSAKPAATQATDEPQARGVTSTKKVKTVFKDAEGNPIEAVVPDVTDPPPPGTLRPLNEAEIAHQERLKRPFNVHFAHVHAFWNLAARYVGPHDPALMKECQDMGRFLLDQSRLGMDELNTEEAIRAELALEQKLRAAGIDDPKLGMVLDYINSSASTVLQGGDPAGVPKPDLDERRE